jgi:hypothetical protein
MKSILLGHDRNSRKPIRIPTKAFQTHFHLIGGTGKGKTTALHAILHQLLRDNPCNNSCWFIFDRLGSFSHELLLWMSSLYCPEHVRDRLIYVEPSREDVVLGFNPLVYETPAHGYYKVERATEIVLRAWESVNIEAMPRLARWVFNAFWAAAQLGLTIADCVHFLMPGSPYHSDLLLRLPPRLRLVWAELMESRTGEVLRILDSSRNRLKPYFESDILRRMFGATRNRMDVLRFMREGSIVLFNLSPQNRLSSQLANTIGALVLNEILATARSLPRGVRYPTYLMLDEFQNFVGPDLVAALPEVRQLGIRLLLSHQSFSQLRRGDYDLTNMIFQAQSRLIFGLQGEDADILAHELASISFDPMRIKDEIRSRVDDGDFEELRSRSYFSFEEHTNMWAREIRNRPTGSAFLRLVDDPNIYDVDVKRSAPGYLAWDMERLARDLPEALEEVNELVERNFRSELFVSPSVIEAETQERLEAVLQRRIAVESGSIALAGTQERAASPISHNDVFA